MGRKRHEKLAGLVELGNRLKELRQRAGLSQMQIAARMGFTSTHGYKYIFRLEKGLVPNPTLRTIAFYLHGCSATWQDVVDVLPGNIPVPHEKKSEKQQPVSEPKSVPPRTEDRRPLRLKIDFSENTGQRLVDAPHKRFPVPPEKQSEKQQPLGKTESVPPKTEDRRPLRLKIGAELLSRRKAHNQQFWTKFEQTESEAAALLSGRGINANLQRRYFAFLRSCCLTIDAYANSRPKLIEQELEKISKSAIVAGLDGNVLSDLKKLCLRKHISRRGYRCLMSFTLRRIELG